MSTKLYIYETSKELFFEQLKILRSMSLPDKYKKESDVQLFETKSGMFFRVLEPGYGFMNQMTEELGFIFSGYDNRVEDYNQEKEDLADEIDALIASGKYELYSIFYVVNN